jgi:hypothetical protein
MKNPKQNMPKLEEHPKLKDEMACILQENRSTIITRYYDAPLSPLLNPLEGPTM